MICKSCGNEIPTGASVCPKCGKSVETIMVAEEKKPETVAASAPQTAPAAPEKKSKAKPDKLTLPVILLIISGAGLFYLYTSNTLSSILSWFTSSGEEKNLRPEIIRSDDPMLLIGNIGAIAVTVLFCLIGIAGLVVLFRRLARKFSSR